MTISIATAIVTNWVDSKEPVNSLQKKKNFNFSSSKLKWIKKNISLTQLNKSSLFYIREIRISMFSKNNSTKYNKFVHILFFK